MSNALDLVNHELPENITSEWVDVQVAYSRDCRVLSDQHLNLAIEKDTSAIRHATLATEGQAELERRWETNRKTGQARKGLEGEYVNLPHPIEESKIIYANKVRFLLDIVDSALTNSSTLRKGSPLSIEVSTTLRKILGQLHSILMKPVHHTKDANWKMQSLDRITKELAEIFPVSWEIDIDNAKRKAQKEL